MSAKESPLKLQNLKASDVLESLTDGVYATDTDRRIVFWNRAAERITGWSRDDVLGKCCRDNILEHFDKDGHPLCGEEHCPLHRAIVTDSQSHGPIMVFTKSKTGKRIPMEVSVSPLRDESDHVVGGLEVFRDLTDAVEELEQAAVVQSHSLSNVLPPDPRIEVDILYSPENLVGGDFYRMEQVDQDHYAFMVADVMGHGVASALFSMQIRSLWENMRQGLMNPCAFLNDLNGPLYTLTKQDNYFATAAFFVLNAATGQLLFSMAGHPAAQLFSANGEVRSLQSGGPGLGLFPEAEYKEGGDVLDPGDTLLLFTDGAFEVLNGAGEELHEEGLVKMLQDSDFALGKLSLSQVEENLLKYSNQLRLQDDLTLLKLYRL